MLIVAYDGYDQQYVVALNKNTAKVVWKKDRAIDYGTTNGDLKKAAQSMKLEVVSAPEFTRNGAIEGLGSPDAIPEIFTKPVGTIFGPSMVGTDPVVGKITARIEPNMADLASQTSAIRDDIKHTKARERDALFEDGIREQLLKDGKIKIHADVLKRLSGLTS